MRSNKCFKRFNSDDRSKLDSMSIQFNSFYLRDTTWIKKEDVISKIKPLEQGFNKVLLKKIKFYRAQRFFRAIFDTDKRSFTAWKNCSG